MNQIKILNIKSGKHDDLICTIEYKSLVKSLSIPFKSISYKNKDFIVLFTNKDNQEEAFELDSLLNDQWREFLDMVTSSANYKAHRKELLIDLVNSKEWQMWDIPVRKPKWYNKLFNKIKKK